jgi:hypothetical protein
MNPLLAYLLARAKEPSTWAGLGIFFGSLAVSLPRAAAPLTVAAAVCGALAAARRDPTSTATEAPAPAIAAEINQEK